MTPLHAEMLKKLASNIDDGLKYYAGMGGSLDAQRAITAACLAGAAALEPWQEIESAPKDGQSILVYFPQIGVWCVSWETTPFADGFWCVYDNKSEPRPLRGWSVDPTHWMPLPAPPAGWQAREERDPK